MPELLEHVRAMSFDGLLGDVEHRADLVVGVRLRHELDDLLLARSEQLAMDRLTRARPLEVLAHQRLDAARVEERLTAHRGAAGLDEVTIDRRS